MTEQEGFSPEGGEITPEAQTQAETEVPQEIKIVPAESKTARKFGSRAPFWGAAAMMAFNFLGEKAQASQLGNWVKDLAKTAVIQVAQKEYAGHEQRRIERKAAQTTEALNAGVEIENLVGKRILINQPEISGNFMGYFDQDQFAQALGGIFDRLGANTVVPWSRAEAKARERGEARANLDVRQSTVARPGTIERENLEADVSLAFNRDWRDLRTELGRGYYYLEQYGIDLAAEGQTATIILTLRDSESQKSIGTLVAVGSAKDTTQFAFLSPRIQMESLKFGDQTQSRAVCSALNNLSQALENAQKTTKESPIFLGEIQDVDRTTNRANINLGKKDNVRQGEIFGLIRTKTVKDHQTGASREITYSTNYLFKVTNVYEDNSEGKILKFENKKLRDASANEVKNALHYRLTPFAETSAYQKSYQDWLKQTGGPEKVIVAPPATKK